MISVKRIHDVFHKLRGDRGAMLILDGGTGEELFRRGVPDDRKIWSATAVVHPKYHKVLQEVHQSFVKAGSGAITTNSYGIVPGVGFSDAEIVQHVSTAGRLARESLGGNKDVIVCGSLGPLVESYRPDRLLPHDKGVSVYRMMTKAFSPYVDCYLAETMSSGQEALQAVEAIGGLEANACHPMLCSYTLKSDGALRSGEEASDAILLIVKAAQRHRVHLLAVLFNCCEPEAVTLAMQNIEADHSLKSLLQSEGILVGAYANRLKPISTNWALADSDGAQELRQDMNPQTYYEKFVRLWMEEYGLQIVGGCCGITPEHIKYIHAHASSTKV